MALKLPKNLAVRLEYYHDADPTDPGAYSAFHDRWVDYDPMDDGFQTVVIDSLTFMQMRKYHDCKFNTMKHAKHAMKWFADITDHLEMKLMGTFASLRCNVVVVAHVSREKDEAHGTMVYFPNAPGRLGPKGGGLPSGFAETYRAYVETDKNGNDWLLQTEKDERFAACTQIMAPDGCAPKYSALWKNWKGPKVPLHVLVYGDAGSKKSILAADFPQPILVQMFDPFGKHLPYVRVGDPQEIKFNKTLGIYTQNILKR